MGTMDRGPLQSSCVEGTLGLVAVGPFFFARCRVGGSFGARRAGNGARKLHLRRSRTQALGESREEQRKNHQDLLHTTSQQSANVLAGALPILRRGSRERDGIRPEHAWVFTDTGRSGTGPWLVRIRHSSGELMVHSLVLGEHVQVLCEMCTDPLAVSLPARRLPAQTKPLRHTRHARPQHPAQHLAPPL